MFALCSIFKSIVPVADVRPEEVLQTGVEPDCTLAACRNLHEQIPMNARAYPHAHATVTQTVRTTAAKSRNFLMAPRIRGHADIMQIHAEVRGHNSPCVQGLLLVL